MSIATAIEINANIESYYFSDDADVTIGSCIYSLRSKINYNSQGEFDKLLIYHPEGILEYDSSLLYEDPKFFESFGYPISTKEYFYKNDSLYKNIDHTVQVEKIDNNYLKSKVAVNKKVSLYILE